MAGETKTVAVAPGVEIELTEWTPSEMDVFNRDYSKVTALHTQNSTNGKGQHVIADWFEENTDVLKVVGQAAKAAIQPTAGVFQGMRAVTGYGFTMIRPDYLFPTAQGRTYESTILAATANSFYGWAHNGAIGAAYNATPLYLRKELALGLVGQIELNPAPMVDELQWEINGKPTPLYNMAQQMRSSGFPAFRYPTVEYIKPAVQFRSQMKVNAAAGTVIQMPLGLAFVTSDFMRQTAPTAPSTTAP